MGVTRVYSEAQGGALVSETVTEDPPAAPTADARLDIIEPTVDDLVIAVLGG